MWQDILAYAIVGLAAGLVLYKYVRKLTGKAPCCDGGCSCSGSCPSAGAAPGKGGLKMADCPGAGKRSAG